LGTDVVIGEGLLRTLSPCWAESGSAAVLLLLCAALAVIQNVSSKSWHASQQAAGVVFKPGMFGRETGFLVSSCIVLTIHLGYALASAISLPDLPYHTAHHAALALVWLIMVRQEGCCGKGREVGGHRGLGHIVDWGREKARAFGRGAFSGRGDCHTLSPLAVAECSSPLNRTWQCGMLLRGQLISR